MSNNNENVVKDVKRRWNKDGFLAIIIAGILLVVCFFAAEPSVPKDEFDELAEKYVTSTEYRDSLEEQVQGYRGVVEELTEQVNRLTEENETFKTEMVDIENELAAFPIYLRWDPNQETKLLWASPNTLINYTENTNFVSRSILVLLEDGKWKFYDFDTHEEMDEMEVHNGLEINGVKAVLQSTVLLSTEDIIKWKEGGEMEW